LETRNLLLTDLTDKEKENRYFARLKYLYWNNVDVSDRWKETTSQRPIEQLDSSSNPYTQNDGYSII